MGLRPSKIRAGERATLALNRALFGEGDDVVDLSVLDVCREFAFSSENADDFAYWYLRSECFSKFLPDDPELQGYREEAAMEKFMEAEHACGLANSRLVDVWTRARLDLPVWAKARALVGGVLGAFPWEQFPWECRFGPGASGSLTRKRASHQNKWVLSTHITAEALPYYAAFKRWSTLDLPENIQVVEGNRVTTVPKSFKTDRCIAVEPDWNMFFQLGVGSLIRQRLNRVGLLTPDAQAKNRALAQEGSRTGLLATLDMSSASDSVSLALCEALLPTEWFRVLMDLRSSRGVLPDGSHVTYEKISSMGNGYTFELETLLFWALTTAVCGERYQASISVYGDDIICPADRALEVMAILVEAGFKVNSTKSFWSGPFRESCGGHFWNGVDVTPFYLRRHPTTIGDFQVLGNAIVRWCSDRRALELDEFATTYNVVRREVPRSLRGPYGLSGVLWDEWDRCCPVWSKKTQSYRQAVIHREHRYALLSESLGAYLHKLWVVSPEVEASRLAQATSREKTTTLYLCRDQWRKLPVRLA